MDKSPAQILNSVYLHWIKSPKYGTDFGTFAAEELRVNGLLASVELPRDYDDILTLNRRSKED